MKLTPARRSGLEVLAITGYADYSNETKVQPRGDFGGRIYWQTADWLLENGYARTTDGSRTSPSLVITDAGRRLAAELGALDG